MMSAATADNLLIACDQRHRSITAEINAPSTSNDVSQALIEIQGDLENRMVGTEAGNTAGMRAKARTLRRLMSGGDEPQQCPAGDDIERMTWSLVVDVLEMEPNAVDVPTMPLGQAAALFDALRTVKDVILGLCCQHRFHSEGGLYNEAGEYLDNLAEVIGLASDQIAEAAEAAKPDEASDDFADRAAILIMDAFHCGGVTTAADRAIALYGKPEAA